MDELRGPSALIQGGKPSSITKACKNVFIAPKRGIVENIFFTRDEVHVALIMLANGYLLSASAAEEWSEELGKVRKRGYSSQAEAQGFRRVQYMRLSFSTLNSAILSSSGFLTDNILPFPSFLYPYPSFAQPSFLPNFNAS